MSQAKDSDLNPRLRRIAMIRSYVALGMFSIAAAVSLWQPPGGLALVCCVLLIYLSSRVPERFHRQKSRS